MVGSRLFCTALIAVQRRIANALNATMTLSALGYSTTDTVLYLFFLRNHLFVYVESNDTLPLDGSDTLRSQFTLICLNDNDIQNNPMYVTNTPRDDWNVLVYSYCQPLRHSSARNVSMTTSRVPPAAAICLSSPSDSHINGYA